MRRGRLTILLLAVGFITLGAVTTIPSVSKHANADSSVGWIAGTPQISQFSELTKLQAQALSINSCKAMTIPVVRVISQQLLTNNEPHCMVNTSEGLVAEDASVFQPIGYTNAYPIDLNVGGHPTVRPVPNTSAAFLVNGDSVYPGVNVGLYKMLSSHLKFNNNILFPRYSLNVPDLYFKYPSGRVMAFLTTGSFSNDGKYWVAEGVSFGFVRVNLATLEMTTFAPNAFRSPSGDLFPGDASISPTGKYVAIAYNAPQGWGNKYFKIVDIDSCGEAKTAYSAATSTCKSTDYWAKLQQAILGLSSINNVRFASDNSMNFIATSGSGANAKYYQYAMSPSGQPTRLEEYLGMGDSFASGEGTFNYILGTDQNPNKCHQSIYSYPYLMSSSVGSSASVACSGAVMRNVVGDPDDKKSNQLKGILDTDILPEQRGVAITHHVSGVVAQTDFINIDNPQIVTVSIGGNDVGFSSIITRCVAQFKGKVSNPTCYDNYEDRKELVESINRQLDNLVNTYTQLKGTDPTRRVYVVGYPQIIQPDGNCAVNVHMNKSETEFAAQVTSYLNSVIELAAKRAGVFYVDTQHAFDGHRLCNAGDKAVNGLTAGNDTWLGTGNESYHPNVLGHELLANTILAATRGLSAPMPEPQNVPLPPQEDLTILDVPKANRPLNYVVSNGDDIYHLQTGDTEFKVEGFQNIVMPNSSYTAILHSTPVNVGTLQADQNGVITGTLHVPFGTEPGIHTLHLYGKNIFGEATDVQTTVYLAASADDYDGDGISNSVDPCPSLPQSGQDIDEDGIDDACDPIIGAPPVKPEQPEAGQPAKTTIVEVAVVSHTGNLQNGPNAIGQSQLVNTPSVQYVAQLQNTIPQESINSGNILGDTTTKLETKTFLDNTQQQSDSSKGNIWLVVLATALLIITLGSGIYKILNRKPASV